MDLYAYLDKNLSFLTQPNHPMSQWLKQHGAGLTSLKEELFFNNWGAMDIPLPGGGSIFAAMPPAAYYREWIRVEKAETSVTIVLGCNLGYGVNKLLENMPESHKVVVIEPDAARLGACLGLTDYTPFFESNRLFFIPPDKSIFFDVMQRLDLHIFFGSIFLRVDMPSQQFGGEYAYWGRVLREMLEDFTVEMATLRRRQDDMVKNEIGNYKRAFADGSVTRLKGSAKGLSAVILGAGPSLAKTAPKLAECSAHALFTAGLQTLPALRDLGLTPDFCLALDYSRGMLKVFDRLDRDWAAQIPLLYSTKVLPEVVDNYPGPTIPFWTVGGLATSTLREREFVLEAGGNVSVALLRILAYFGVSSVLLAGQDLSWKGETSHVAGHHSKGKKVFNPKRHIKMKNLDGEEIITTSPYIAAKRDMERDLAKIGLPAYNIYGGGVEIKGARPISVDEAFTQGLLSSAPGAMRRFQAAFANARTPVSKPVFEPRAPKWASSLRNVSKRLEKLFKRPDKHQSDIHKVMEQTHIFLRQDPLYAPYLYNEIIDIAGLSRARSTYSRPDLSEFRAVTRRVLSKVREMDRVVGDSARKKVEAA